MGFFGKSANIDRIMNSVMSSYEKNSEAGAGGPLSFFTIYLRSPHELGDVNELTKNMIDSLEIEFKKISGQQQSVSHGIWSSESLDNKGNKVVEYDESGRKIFFSNHFELSYNEENHIRDCVRTIVSEYTLQKDIEESSPEYIKKRDEEWLRRDLKRVIGEVGERDLKGLIEEKILDNCHIKVNNIRKNNQKSFTITLQVPGDLTSGEALDNKTRSLKKSLKALGSNIPDMIQKNTISMTTYNSVLEDLLEKIAKNPKIKSI